MDQHDACEACSSVPRALFSIRSRAMTFSDASAGVWLARIMAADFRLRPESGPMPRHLLAQAVEAVASSAECSSISIPSASRTRPSSNASGAAIARAAGGSWRCTSLLGAVLVTGFLGGAVATHVRLGNPLLSHVLFGVYVGVLMWSGLPLRDPRLRGWYSR
jgi:hypothetical protein